MKRKGYRGAKEGVWLRNRMTAWLTHGRSCNRGSNNWCRSITVNILQENDKKEIKRRSQREWKLWGKNSRRGAFNTVSISLYKKNPVWKPPGLTALSAPCWGPPRGEGPCVLRSPEFSTLEDNTLNSYTLLPLNLSTASTHHSTGMSYCSVDQSWVCFCVCVCPKLCVCEQEGKYLHSERYCSVYIKHKHTITHEPLLLCSYVYTFLPT